MLKVRVGHVCGESVFRGSRWIRSGVHVVVGWTGVGGGRGNVVDGSHGADHRIGTRWIRGGRYLAAR